MIARTSAGWRAAGLTKTSNTYSPGRNGSPLLRIAPSLKRPSLTTTPKLVPFGNRELVCSGKQSASPQAVRPAESRSLPSGSHGLAQTDAQDTLDAATAALDQLQTALTELEAESSRANRRVEAAVNAVLATAAMPLVRQLPAGTIGMTRCGSATGSRARSRLPTYSKRYISGKSASATSASSACDLA